MMRMVVLGLAASGMLLATAAGSYSQDDAAADSPTAESPSAENPEPGAVEVKPATAEDTLEADLAIPSKELREARDGAKNAEKAKDNQWRFRWHNGRWWYWMPSSKWVVWDGKAWAPYTGQVLSDRGNFGGGYFGNTYYDDGYYGGGGYYGNQYYGNSGYYGNTYYGNGGYYPSGGYRGYGYGRSPYSSGYRGGSSGDGR